MNFITYIQHNKKIVASIAVIFILTSGFFTAKVMNHYKNTKIELTGTKNALTFVEKENSELKITVQKLLKRISELQEQIYRLKEAIKTKDANIQQLTNSHNQIVVQLQSVGQRKRQLEAQFEKLAYDKSASDEQLREIYQQLEFEKNQVAMLKEANSQLKKQIEFASVQVQNDSTEIENLEKQRKALEIENIQHTELAFVRGELYNAQDKPIVKKISDNPGAWRKSIFQINFSHPNPDMIEGKYFGVEIFDVTNNKPLAIEESNKMTGTIGNTMIIAQLTGGILNVQLTNNEQKSGKIYRLQVYYIPDPNDLQNRHLIKNSRTLNIVLDGKVKVKNKQL